MPVRSVRWLDGQRAPGRRREEPIDCHRADPHPHRARRRARGSPPVRRRRMGTIRADAGPGTRALRALYAKWFRAEWEGLEKIPTEGGALLVANHAGAIPSDAPVIMHGIEKELGRPVYGLADYFFRTVPVVGTLWARAGGVSARPANAYRLLKEQQPAGARLPRGDEGTVQVVHRPLPAPPIRPRRLRRDRHAGRRPGHADRRRGLRGGDARGDATADCGPGPRTPLFPDHGQRARPRAARVS